MSVFDGFLFEIGRGAARVVGGGAIVLVLLAACYAWVCVDEWRKKRRAS